MTNLFFLINWWNPGWRGINRWWYVSKTLKYGGWLYISEWLMSIVLGAPLLRSYRIAHAPFACKRHQSQAIVDCRFEQIDKFSINSIFKSILMPLAKWPAFLILMANKTFVVYQMFRLNKCIGVKKWHTTDNGAVLGTTRMALLLGNVSRFRSPQRAYFTVRLDEKCLCRNNFQIKNCIQSTSRIELYLSCGPWLSPTRTSSSLLIPSVSVTLHRLL